MEKPLVSLIVARSRNGVIGRDGALPWHLSADLKHFKRQTVGKPVVMGRKTFDSIGKPLPGRHNIVVTRNADWKFAGVTVVPNIAEAIAAAGLDLKIRAPEIMIIGGADIYAQCLQFADRLYLTDVQVEIAGDAFFPPLDETIWRETARVDYAAGAEQPAFSFRLLERKPL
jgi:dihydrofolate reductase